MTYLREHKTLDLECSANLPTPDADSDPSGSTARPRWTLARRVAPRADRKAERWRFPALTFCHARPPFLPRLLTF